MSQRTMTRALLDFGSSFWSSELIKEEFPGLRSSGFRSIGQYGIGFYSVFMVASGVTVSTRNWESGLDSISSMEFPKGISLRPTFTKGRPNDFPSWASTRVRCLLLPKFANDAKGIEVKQHETPSITINIADFLPRLVCGLDVKVEANLYGGGTILIHTPPTEIICDPIAKQNWLRGIALWKYKSTALVAALDEAAERLRPIFFDGELAGLAALSLEPDQNGTGLTTIGGLLSGGSRGLGGIGSYFGYIDNRSASAKRESGARVADNETIRKWALDQQDLLRIDTLTLAQRFVAGHHFCDFDIDPLDFALVLFFINGQPTAHDLSHAVEIMKNNTIAIFRMRQIPVVDVYMKQMQFQNYITYRPTAQGGFNSLEMDGGVPKKENSFLGCIYRRARVQGLKMVVQEVKDAAESGIGGPADVLLISLQGK